MADFMIHRLTNNIVVVAVAMVLIGLIPLAGASVIHVEYFHTSRCSECELTYPIIADLKGVYGSTLNVEEIDVNTLDGWERWHQYAFLEVPAVVVNGTVKIPKEEITDENLRAAIEQSLAGAEPQENSPPINWNIPFAFSLGLFSGFSPCLMAILGFILVYVTGSGKGLRSSLLNSVIFGLGLVAAYIVLGCCFLLAGMSLGGFGPYLAVAAGLITILTGVNLLGLIKLPISADDYVKSSIRKHATTLAGLLILGMIFSIFKAPCAAPYRIYRSCWSSEPGCSRRFSASESSVDTPHQAGYGSTGTLFEREAGSC
jgi:cytochrome c-type biogenesis protein